MSQAPELLVVEPVHREGLARTCIVRLGSRQFLTPSFAIRIDSQEKLDLYLRLKKSHRLPYVCGYVIRLTDAQRTLGRRIRQSSQVDLHGQFVDDDFLRSTISDLVMIEPALENLYYGAHLGDFALSPKMPAELVSYALAYDAAKEDFEEGRDKAGERTLRTWLDENHSKFWGKLERDERKRARFIRDILVREVEFGATILIPPVPLITNLTLFELAKIINEKSSEVSRLVGECAQAFTFRIDALRSSSLMDELTEFIHKTRARLTIFKFKYMNLNEEDRIVERGAFRKLIQELDLTSRIDPNRAFMLLEAGNQTFACAGRGFDFLSTSFSVDREDRMKKKERSPWGKWYDPWLQTPLSRDVFLESYRNNGMRIPDDCAECLSTTTPEALSLEDWNKFVKRHYLHRRDKDYGEIADAISKGTASAGTVNRLKDSVLKNLVELIR